MVTDSANYDEPRNARRIRDLSIQKTKGLRRLRGGGSLLRKVLVASVLVKSHNAVVAESAGSKSVAESSEKLSSDDAAGLLDDGGDLLLQPVSVVPHPRRDDVQLLPENVGDVADDACCGIHSLGAYCTPNWTAL